MMKVGVAWRVSALSIGLSAAAAAAAAAAAKATFPAARDGHGCSEPCHRESSVDFTSIHS